MLSVRGPGRIPGSGRARTLLRIRAKHSGQQYVNSASRRRNFSFQKAFSRQPSCEFANTGMRPRGPVRRTIMIKGLFAVLMAGTLMIPHITPALGNESTVGVGATRHAPSPLSSWEALSLSPVPYLDTMQWLNSGTVSRGPEIDLLWGPKLDTLRPFLVQPQIPFSRFSSSSEALAPRVTTE